MDTIRLRLASFFNDFENYFIVDSISMPLEVSKLARSSRSKTCTENINTLPNKGYYASQNSK